MAEVAKSLGCQHYDRKCALIVSILGYPLSPNLPADFADGLASQYRKITTVNKPQARLR